MSSARERILKRIGITDVDPETFDPEAFAEIIRKNIAKDPEDIEVWGENPGDVPGEVSIGIEPEKTLALYNILKKKLGIKDEDSQDEEKDTKDVQFTPEEEEEIERIVKIALSADKSRKKVVLSPKGKRILATIGGVVLAAGSAILIVEGVKRLSKENPED